MALTMAVTPLAIADSRPAVETVTASVRPGHGYLELSVKGDTAQRFHIYSITGQLVKTVDVIGVANVELPNGLYIVKCSEWSKQVIVK